MAKGVYYNPWPVGFSMDVPANGNIVKMWKKGVFFKSNPRSFDYMKREFSARWPQAEVIDAVTNPNWEASIHRDDDVVLLFPDATGLGFRGVENKLLSIVPEDRLHVITGRRRYFQLNLASRRALRWRRFLEWTMLPEIGMTIVFLTLTPLLLLIDWARGRR